MVDTNEAELLGKRMAYIDALRGLHRKERLVGFLMILVGAAMVLPARFAAGWPGEAIWVGLYTSIGYGFAGNLTAASDFASSILGFLAAGAVAAGLGGWLITAMRQPHDAPFP